MLYENEGGKSETSLFNEGNLQIGRLHKIWESCRMYKISDNLTSWNSELECAWSELEFVAGKLSQDYETIINHYNIFIAKCYAQSETVIGEETFVGNRKMLRLLLMKKEKLLRRIQNEAGMGGKYIGKEEKGFE